MYEEDLALNNLKVLICYKTQPTGLNSMSFPERSQSALLFTYS